MSAKVQSIVDDIEEQINDLSELVDNGSISLAEFDELVGDIADISKINEKLELEADKILAEKLINAILTVYNL